MFCLACGSDTHASTQGGGNSWQLVSTPSSATHINFFSVKSTNNHWFLADRLSGFWRSTDQGATWSQINTGLPHTNAWSIEVNPANGDLIGSLYKGASGLPGDFYRSTNEGTSWTKIPVSYSFTFGAYIGCVFPNNSIVCGGFWAPFPKTGVWVSSDGGATVTEGVVTPYNASAFGLGYNPKDNILWMGTEQRGVYNSTDGGLTWNQKSPNSTYFDPVNGIGVGNADYFAFDRQGNILLSALGGIWKSTKSGTSYTWTNVLKNNNTSAGRSLGQDAQGNLYYGHNHDTTNPTTVYRSTDDGATWSAFDTGLPQFLEDHEFIVNPIDGKMYTVVGDETTGGWVYSTVNPILSTGGAQTFGAWILQ